MQTKSGSITVGVVVTFCLIISIVAIRLVGLSQSALKYGAIQPLSRTLAYDFRSRTYTDEDVEVDHDVEWLGPIQSVSAEQGAADQGQGMWIMPTRSVSGIRIVLRESLTRNISASSVATPLSCRQGATPTERVHIVLEGPAVLAPKYVHDVNETSSVFEIIAYEPGIYNVHVEAIRGCGIGNDRNNTIHRVRGSPFRLEVHGRADFPRRRCADYRYRHGRWLECHSTPLQCIRTGWVWVADDCYSHVYTSHEIINEKPTWIVLAGTSIERGSFFSLADHLLGPNAANISKSDFWKCWGWSKFCGKVRRSD
jgi:hypothetical protein